MGWTCSMHGADEKFIKILVKTPNGRYNSGGQHA
jgi:hypothetical protein